MYESLQAKTPIITKAAAHFRAVRQKLAFLRRNYYLALAWPIAAVVLAAIGWHFLLSNLEAEKRALENDSLQQTEVLAKSYADQLARAVEAIDQTALHVKYEWEISKGTLRLADAQETGLFPASSILYVAIVDQNGKVVTSTLPALDKAFIGDRIYSLMQRTAATNFLYIDRPVIDDLSKRSGLFFSRRLIRQDGSFGGIVLISVAPHYFTTGYNEAAFMKHGFLGIVGRDKLIRVTRIGQTVHSPQSPALLSVPEFPSQSGSALLEGDQWFRDERNRYVGWQAVEDYPVIAMAGLDRQETLAPYWAKRAVSIQDGILVTLALVVFTIVATALSLRLAWRKHQLELIHTTYRKATESGNEGFYMTRPVYDEHGNISDFEVVDCNRRGAELIRLRREELIGRRISTIYQEPALTVRMNILRQAMETGFYEGEMERPDATYPAHWVKLKIVRYGNDLAVSARDISDTKAHVAELQRRSNEDPLTGLPNRYWVEASLPRAIERAAAANSMLALLFIDLDGFKAVNDTLGHAAGDDVLRNAARRLKDAVRPHDCVTRFGGDEFVVILEQIEHRTDAAHIGERVLRAFQDSFRLSQGEYTVGASIGISVYPADGKDGRTLLRNADIAMYSAKTTGKSNYRFYDENFYEALRRRREQEVELRNAIEHDQFVMVYQPRVDLATGTTTSMEALVRWAHPTKGFICPLEFIPLAEETGLILRLGELVIDKVCAQLACWLRTSPEPVPVSINVSSRQFNESDVANVLALALARHHIAPEMIEIELTETSVMDDSDDVVRALKAIQRMGIKVFVDDFGTGYSSLSQLQRLDFDGLKVDQAFTARLERSEEGCIFFKAIITMAHALGMKVVVEGVETLGQVKILKTLQCDELQGFFLSKPLPPSDVQPILPKLNFA